MSGRVDTRIEAQVATVTMCNPGKLNALDVEMWSQLCDTFLGLAGNDQLRCVVVKGHDDLAFAAGADISEFETQRRTREQVRRYHEETVPRALDAIRNCPVPVIAAIQGACVGGGLEIAAMCDMRVSGMSGRFGIPVARLGFSLAYGEMEPVLDAIGPSVLAELLLEARLLTATEAYVKGIVTQLVDDDAFDRHIAKLVANILACAPLATRHHKRQLRRLSKRGQPLSAEEREESYDFADTADYEIGYRAFLAKTRPLFEGR
jgi:enoyl-CoA hydratase